jgi:D-alanine transaminase
MNRSRSAAIQGSRISEDLSPAIMQVYFNGKYLPKEEVCISPDDRGFLFADSIYEVMRSYQGRIFEIEAHIERLNYGARQLRFQMTDFGFLQEVCANLLRANELLRREAVLYIQVTRGVAPRLHRFPSPDTSLTIYAEAKPFTPDRNAMRHGINVILLPDQRWARCDIKATGLTANVLAHQQALDQDAQEAVFIRDGAVIEGTHSSVLAVFGGCVITPPLTNYMLGSITRRVVLDLCRQLNIPIREKTILEEEFFQADEAMIAGTTTEITPIVKIGGRSLGRGEPGPITRRLQTAFRGLCAGNTHSGGEA